MYKSLIHLLGGATAASFFGVENGSVRFGGAAVEGGRSRSTCDDIKKHILLLLLLVIIMIIMLIILITIMMMMIKS